MSRIGRCEHGRLLRHVPEPTASTGATAGRPSGLHPTACHTASLEAPLDRCSRVEGYCSTRPQPIFTGSSTRDAHWPGGYATAVGTGKSMLGKSSVVLHLPPEVSGHPRRRPAPERSIACRCKTVYATGTATTGGLVRMYSRTVVSALIKVVKPI